MFIPPFAVRRAHLSVAVLIVSSLSASCVSARRQELSSNELHAALSLRANGPDASMDAQSLAGLEVLALARPTPEECADARTAGYWRACTLAWNPAVRAARRELEQALAAAKVAGRPDRIDVGVEAMDVADIGRETRMSATFDLLALLGIGPAQIAREAARVEVFRAHSRLEFMVWAAVFDVERARVRLAASRGRLARLTELLIQVSAQSARFEVLQRRGRLSEADAAMVNAATHEVEHEISIDRGREAELRAELARVSGLAFEHDAYAHVDAGALLEARAIPDQRSERQLFEQDPVLRGLALEFAGAELRVRSVAARAWPTLRAGPQLTFMPSDLLVGGLLDLSLPWPGSVEKEVRIARIEREAARERVEDALHLALARVSSLRASEREARLRADEHALELDEAAEAAWQAVNARLRFNLASPIEWARLMRERITPLVGVVDASEAAAIAALDLAQASGIAPAAREVSP